MAYEIVEMGRGERSWDSFVPFMQPACMGIPVDIQIHHLRLAAIEFTEYTNWLTQTYVIDLQENVGEYPIRPANCMRFIALLKVCYNGHTRYCPAYEPRCCEVSGNRFWYEDGQLQVRPLPIIDEPRALTAEFTVSLSQDTFFVPEALYSNWAETIAMGAIARCLMIAGQPFYDPQSARLFEAKFRSGMVLARQRVERSRIRGPMKMVARRFV